MSEFIKSYVDIEKPRGNFSESLLEKWLEGKGIDQWFYYPNGNMLNPNVRSCITENISMVDEIENFPPCMDHGLLFINTNANKIWLVYQPYNFSNKNKCEVIKWAIENALRASFGERSQSWYSPGRTALVVIEEG